MNRAEPILLFLGDIFFFIIALWLMLAVRYTEFPDVPLFYNHLVPFSFLFVVWVTIYFVAGLYDKHTLLLKRRIPGTILRTQIANVIIAALFFFFIPYFGITPKTNLLIYLVISSVLILFWRLVIFPLLGIKNRQKAILLGTGKEIVELEEEVNNNTRYSFEFILTIDLAHLHNPNDLQKQIMELVAPGNVSIIICDTKDEQLEPLLPLIYNLTFLNTSFHFIDVHKVYEEVFDRIPLSLIQYHWLLGNISLRPRVFYETLKHTIDIVAALVLGFVSLGLYPFVWLAIKLDDGGSLFIAQERIGKNNKPIKIFKFRTMVADNKGDAVLDDSDNEVTRVGEYLRKTRIDELPQLWNVLRGDISLIGPRPELPALVKHYAERILYYNTRHVIKPGLSGWAQIYHERHPHHGSDVTETKNKLSYDLFYIKNRSLLLDFRIALQTLKILFSRSGI